jgi:TonB-linked SusC/RagA family outer membrane protein
MRKKLLLATACLFLLIFNINLLAQPVIINGHVSDASDGESLIFVNVVEVDENGRFVTGATTDMNGNYVLRVSSNQAVIQISYIGYKKQTINVAGMSRINVSLEPETQAIGEVVITGSKMGSDGVVPIRDRATSIGRIELDELKSSMTTTVEDMLQGRLGNVDITAVSGDPGAGLNIRIRGTATLNAQNDPLIVINGIPYDAEIEDNFDFAAADVERFGNLIDVAPEDIESIEVLKDAASTAVWGSRAANGVLMIQTKRGIKSKPIFEYTYKVTQSREPDPIPMLDGSGYAQLITESHYNYDRNVFSSDEIAFDPEWYDSPTQHYYNFAQNTNWVDEITRTGYTQQHNFSVRGGGDKSRYNISMGYNDEIGTTIGNSLKKINLRTSLDYDLSSKLRFTTDILYTRYNQNTTYDVEDYDFDRPKDNIYKTIRTIAYKKMPNMSIYERDTLNNVYDDFFTPQNTIQGSANDIYNPVAFGTLGVHERIKDNARAMFNLRYKPFHYLELSTSVTLDIFDHKINKFLPFKALGYRYEDDLTNKAVNDFSKKSSIFTFTRAVFKPYWGDRHSLIVLGQIDTEESVSRNYNVQTSKSGSPDMQDPIGDKHLNYFRSDLSEFRSAGFFLNAHYKFLDKYIFSFGAKAEGNSRFSKEARWGLFPTVTAAWRLSEEFPLKNVKFINDLKIRGSWGQSGNSPQDNYLYFNTYEAGADFAYLSIPGVQPKGPELTSLKWETIEQSNIGMSFFGHKNRLNIEVDFYIKKTRDLYLKDFEIPDHSGFGTIHRNDGELTNKGWEFLIDYKLIDLKDFEFSFNFNSSRNRNIVIRLPENYSLEYGNMLDNGNYKISIEPGEAIGGFFGYRYLGVYPTDEDAIVIGEDGQPVYGINATTPLRMIHGGGSGYEFEGGDAHYDDINFDGQINELDLVYLGDLNPDFMGGFGTRIQYKKLVLNTFFYYKIGQEIINQTRMDTEKMYNHDNQSLATDWRWRRPGDITNVPRALYQRGFNWMGSDRFVEDGSYVRLKSASISYYLSDKICDKLRIDEMKLYVTGYNLYTWTNYSGQDPDVGTPSKPDELPKDYSRTPPSLRITLGASITF